MSLWTAGTRSALADAVALVTILLEPLEAPDSERMNAALDEVVADLGRSADTDVATVFGVLVSLLLDRLASSTGRGRDELWQEIARGLAVGSMERGEGDGSE